MRRATISRLPAVLVLALLAACATPSTPDLPEPTPAPVPAPDPLPSDVRGPYAVSATTIESVDARGKWMVMEVWYPATPEPDAELEGYPSLNFAEDAYRDSAWDARGAPYPVVAFSHGNGGIRFQSSFLCTWLASHGFVVVAPDHEHNTLLDLSPSLTGQVASERPTDIAQTVDLVAEAFPEMLDLSDGYAMVGHSFGAWTSLVVGGGTVDADELISHCASNDEVGCDLFDTNNVQGLETLDQAVPDARAAVAVALSPGLWYSFGADGRGLADNVPTLVLAGDRDSDLPYETEMRPVYDLLPDTAALGTLIDAAHFGFSDMCTAVPFFDECEGADAGFMEIERVHAVTNTLATAWLRSRWRGEAGEEQFLGPQGTDTLWEE